MIRNKKHTVYLLENGVRFTVANTPSDRHSRMNEVTRLRRILKTETR